MTAPRWWPLALVACAKQAAPPPSPVTSVTVAPQSTASPNEPTLLMGPQRQPEPTGPVERVVVKDDRPDGAWTPSKDRCPDGITEMMSVHVPLGQTMELPSGAEPVSALGTKPDAVDVLFDRGKKRVRVTARKYGLVFVTVARETKCTLYGVSTGY